jgi:phospholipid/cholesterol/gamma-HCH transport system ATP-binding protein
MDDICIEVKNLRYSIFDSNLKENKMIIDNISFNLFRGESFFVLGTSGCGKSTLLKLIAGLSRPTSGEVRIGDCASNNQFLDSNYFDRIGFLFQYSALFDFVSTWGNIVFKDLFFYKKNRDECFAKAEKLIEMVGLKKDDLDKKVSQLSGGMQKRVGLARAIANNPDLLILDEPTSGLDPVSSRVIDELIVSLQKSKNITIITVSHDPLSVYRVADRVAFMKDGCLDWVGNLADIESCLSLGKFLKGES